MKKIDELFNMAREGFTPGCWSYPEPIPDGIFVDGKLSDEFKEYLSESAYTKNIQSRSVVDYLASRLRCFINNKRDSKLDKNRSYAEA